MNTPLQLIHDKTLNLANSFFAQIPLLVMALLIVVITYIFDVIMVHIIKRSLMRLGLRDTLIEVIHKLASIGIWIIGLLIAAAFVFPSLTPAGILGALGIGSIAIGLAFKDIFENFMAGIFILYRDTFSINDFIECQNVKGRVERINIRNTHIRQSDGQRVVIPNSMLFKNPVNIVTDMESRRTSIICSIDYKYNVDEVRKIIYDVVKNTETVVKNKDIFVLAHQFSPGNVDFEIFWWTKPNPMDLRKSHDKVIAALHKKLKEENIDLAGPDNELTFKEVPLFKVEVIEKNEEKTKGIEGDHNR